MLFVCLFVSLSVKAISLGTEIWIEPGQSKEYIYDCVRRAKESGFEDIRIFIMWTHVEPQKGKWDFEIYDHVFRACEINALRLQVTLNPNQPAYHYGRHYWSSIHSHKIFYDSSLLDYASLYIKNVVERYKNSSALDNWWLMNEPMVTDVSSPFFISEFQKYMREKYKTIEKLNREWNSNFISFDEIDNIDDLCQAEWAASAPYYDWKYAQNRFLTQFQSWVCSEIKKYDFRHGIHTNPAGLLSSFHRQETLSWRPFLNSLGVSIHPAWHFDMFKPCEFSMAVSATCNLGRNNAGLMPFWVSELSGGDSMYRYCPSESDIVQWTWSAIMEGADKILYWLLNAREKGMEAGEWSLLNYKKRPSGRLLEIMEINKILNAEKTFSMPINPYRSRVTILVSSITNMTLSRIKADDNLHLYAVMACYKALYEKGISVNIQQIEDYDWANKKDNLVILPEVITMTDEQIDNLKQFLTNGNKLVALGPIAFYGENEKCNYLDFPFKKEFGSEPLEISTVSKGEDFRFASMGYHLEACNLSGKLENSTSKAIARLDEKVLGIRMKDKDYEVVWMLPDIAAGNWNKKNNDFSSFLLNEIEDFVNEQPFELSESLDNVGLQTAIGENYAITLINNGNEFSVDVYVNSRYFKNVKELYPLNTYGSYNGGKIKIKPKGSIVLLWN